ncbi:aminopeptidase 2, putative [Entamoeba invadens IP1]|uniref:Aminopeptidase n=1 Tax=Entamoeba invadens IP1 TaxID=370355 RepID=A0A0A1U2H5_ENTIV|nr:aminopeptidase 2, putative [Entamoeba invadens IP1]ELP88281.1 aminopeptidase 2, putative [Entamoeba invadens IP1]|eukprot:XP_004255052.1 aminopeptidase 2, putative [Entamoeba invadens IP1]
MSQLLPTNFVPLHYEVFIKPYPSQRKFIGKTVLTLLCTTGTNVIVMNAVNLNNICAVLQEECDHLKITENPTYEQITLTSNNKFNLGEHQVTIQYEGRLPDDELCGFYQSKYTFNGKEKVICCTQFCPSSARRVFPCLDEPNYKATFSIILEVPPTDDCFSNMPIKSVELTEQTKKVTFETTPKMSTYILAFVTGEFTSYTKVGKNGIQLGLHFARNHKNISRFALEVMDKCLSLYESQFKIRYPLTKCDWVALPDFECGAMENWGIITSRETEVCLKENASTQAKKRSASVVCHELAHMWFGDLVTMKWWDDIWLNEGFASYVGTLFGVSTLFPEWRMEAANVVESLIPALESDGSINTHPICIKVDKASDVQQVFDLISYNKGSALINMIVNYVGFDSFMNGVTAYLNKFLYQNATSDDMWDCVGNVCGIDLKEVVQEWTYASGFPMVSVRLERGKLYLEQERCGVLSDQIWQIPMILSYENKVVKYIFKDKKSVIEWQYPYVIANAKSSGFYRVKYSDDLITLLEKTKISHLEVLTLCDDLFTLGKLGVLSSTQYLSFIRQIDPITVETYQLSRCILKHFSELKTVFKDSRVKRYIRQQMKRLLFPIYSELGYNVQLGESSEATSLRSCCVALFKRKEFYNNASRSVLNNEIGRLSGELILPTCYIAGRYGDDVVFSKLCQLYTTGETVEIRRVALKAIASTKNEELIKKALSFIESTVRQQDVGFAFAELFSGESELPTDYVITHINDINKKYGGGMSSIRKCILNSMLGKYSTRDRVNFFMKFFEDHKCEGSENCIKQGIEKMSTRASWLERDFPNILQCIES